MSSPCALRLSVRTPDFHSGKRGSIPLGRTIFYLLKSMTYKKKGCFRNIITFRSKKLIASAITDEDSFIKLGEYFAYTQHIKVINFNYLAPSIFNNCYSIHASIIR